MKAAISPPTDTPEFPGDPRAPQPLGESGSLLRLISRVTGYLPALAGLAVAIGFQFLSVSLTGRNLAGLFFVYLATILVAAWCGYGPGILVVLLVAGGVPFLFRPDFSLRKIDPSGVVMLSMVSALVS